MTDLQSLQEYYEHALCDRIFQYKLNNGDILQIRFFRESFCHLLGIQHITSNRHYIGKAGYDCIHAGNMTARHLKNINRAGFSRIERRISYFTHIGHLMQHGSIFRFYPERVGRTRIQATHLVYEENERLYLHLFLKRESKESNLYVPISYIALTERDDNPSLYIAGQEYKTIAEASVLPIDTPFSQTGTDQILKDAGIA